MDTWRQDTVTEGWQHHHTTISLYHTSAVSKERTRKQGRASYWQALCMLTLSSMAVPAPFGSGLMIVIARANGRARYYCATPGCTGRGLHGRPSIGGGGWAASASMSVRCNSPTATIWQRPPTNCSPPSVSS